MNRDDLYHLVEKTIDDRQEIYLNLGHEIYKNPETGYKEFQTTKTLSSAFTSLGLEVIENIAFTGCRAYSNKDKKGPKIAIIGELDALKCPSHPDANPETGAVHACGHNIQTTVMYGVADALIKSGVLSSLGGQVDFIAVPAEEVIELDYRESLKDQGKIKYYSGKIELLSKGALDDVDICMMIHSYPFEDQKIKLAIDVSSNGFLGKQITFLGKQAHAGQAPWDGINALNMSSLAISGMHYQRETFKDKDTVRIHQIITKGGDVVNSVPEQVNMETTVRANNIEALLDANMKVNRSIRGAAVMLGGKAFVKDSPGQLPVITNKQLADIFHKQSLKIYDESQILPHIQWTGSTDMGDVSSLKPSIHCLTSGISGGLHTSNYRIVSNEEAYINPIKILSNTVVDLLINNAEKATEIIESFEPSMSKESYLKYLADIEKSYTLE